MLRRNELWGLDTVEFRIVHLITSDINMREYIFRLQVLDRLSDAAYMSGIGHITQESATRYLNNNRKVREDVVLALSPDYSDRDKRTKQQQSEPDNIDVKKMNYIKALQGLHSGSLQDFMDVRNEFNAALAEKNKHDTGRNDTLNNTGE